MTDLSGESRYTQAGDEAGFQTRSSPPSSLPAEGEGSEPGAIRRTPYPVSMLVAGVLWVQAGVALIAVFGFSRLWGVPLGLHDLGPLGLAAYFTWSGIRLIQGRTKAAYLYGFSSVVVGLALIGLGLVLYTPRIVVNHPRVLRGNPFSLPLFVVVVGMASVAPGIFILLGRRAYLAWQKEKALAERIKALDATEDRGEEPPKSVNQAVKKASD